MINFSDWIKNNGQQDTWLIIGKGPSYAQLADYESQISDFRKLSLNHVVRDLAVDVAHFTDLDALIDCQDVVEANAKFLVLPLHPHVNFRPSDQALDELIKSLDILETFNQQGRLLWYNSSLASKARHPHPVIPVLYFSADAAVALLAYSGVKTLRSLGIDGGIDYCPAFEDLNKTTLLTNGQPSFDKQFLAIANTIMKTGVDFLPMTESGPIKVYVGAQHEQMLAVKVLEYTIKKYASISTEIFPMHLADIDIPMPRDKANQPRTPFSFQRFLIPELNGFAGKAIYVDSDMMLFTDIKRLWSQDMGAADICSAWEASDDNDKPRIPQFSVMLLDCGALKWTIRDIIKLLDDGTYCYEEVLHEMRVAKHISPSIDGEWNSLEHYEEGKTCLLHYTDMNTQPWLNRTNKHGDVWVSALIEAVNNDFISLDFVRQDILAGNVRPSLLWQVVNDKPKSKSIPRFMRSLDKGFTPPHKAFAKGAPTSLKYKLLNALLPLAVKLL